MAAMAALAALSLALWVVLWLGRNRFWDPESGKAPPWDGPWPEICAVIPARDEAEVLPETLPAVLGLDYPGELRMIVVDDGSSDGTAATARRIARNLGSGRLTVLSSPSLPPGWTGKLWAMEQGVRAAGGAGFILFTDADIAYPAGKLREIVSRALADDLDLVSLMVRLRAESGWERFLIPPFVYFFALLYPFRRVCDPCRRTAAAAGGSLLVRREALERAGGLAAVRGALIDDCSLAARIKDAGRPGRGRIWLGMAKGTRSVRPYGGVEGIWMMVARTAFVQLRFSGILLALTMAAMLLVFAVPPAATLVGIGLWLAGGGTPSLLLAGSGLAAWGIMARTYLPTVRLYGISPPCSFLLPAAALLYALMTLDSARRFAAGHGGMWKGRAASPRRQKSAN